MISKEQLHEFGFENIERFPRSLNDHEVSISLPSAITNGVAAVNVVIDKGIAIPVQIPSVPNGMIIRNNGTMVYVSHRIPEDQTSALQATFTDDISYDIRLESYNIMRRAVEVDEQLRPVWEEIQGHWLHWYPPFIKEIARQSSGQYTSIGEAAKVLDFLLAKFITDVKNQTPQAATIPLRINVQTLDELHKGWQGEEFIVDQITVGQIMLIGLEKYCTDQLKGKLKKVLKDPVFSSRATFEVFYEPRAIPVIKLVIENPPGADDIYQGIDLT